MTYSKINSRDLSWLIYHWRNVISKQKFLTLFLLLYMCVWRSWDQILDMHPQQKWICVKPRGNWLLHVHCSSHTWHDYNGSQGTFFFFFIPLFMFPFFMGEFWEYCILNGFVQNIIWILDAKKITRIKLKLG